MITISARLFLAAIAALLLAGTAWSADPDVDRARALMKEGKAAEAYQLLWAREAELAGNVEYDYVLGIAALDAGKPDQATLAFERVLAVDPNFAGARLDMARAYFQLGDFARAKTEFQTVLALNPPAAAKATAENHLRAIDQREKAGPRRGSLYLEAGYGHDSNVNSSTSQGQIEVPALGNLLFTLNANNVETADSYATYALGGEASTQFSPSVLGYAGLDVRSRDYRDQDAFDSLSADLRAGLGYARNRELFKAGVIAGKFQLDGETNRNTSGLTAEWHHFYSAATRSTVFAQHARYRFPDPAVKVNDFDQTAVGIAGLRAGDNGRRVLFGALLAGTETADQRADGGRKFAALRVGVQWPVGESAELFAAAGAQSGRYDKDNAAFLKTREDKQYDVNLGVNWHFGRAWTLRPQVARVRNDSNISLYSFNRTDASLNLRWDWR